MIPFPIKKYQVIYAECFSSDFQLVLLTLRGI